MLKKIGALIASMSVALAPASSLLTSTFSRATIGAFVGTTAVMLPSAAHAESSYRICAITLGQGGDRLAIAMKVSKYDIGTCGAAFAGIQAALGLMSLAGMARAALASGAGQAYYYNATCERFSSDLSVSGDVCYSMPQQYRLYGVFHGRASTVSLK
ncbi:MAG: hypothetical protein JF606_28445 [Burkholderiales bacterium]|jgi:hypothetical protein|nr:hypothetical protein [Burkholderiales bacterium]